MGPLILFLTAAGGALLGAEVMHLWDAAIPKKKFHKEDGASLPRILTSLDVAYYCRDVASGREECSDKLHEMLGLAPGDYSFAALCKALPDVHAATLTQAVGDAEKNTSPIVLALYLDEGKRQVECTVTCTRDIRGKPAEIIVWFRDVTAAQKLQLRMTKENEQLKRDMKQLSSILNTLPIPVWLRGADFTIRYCNLAYSEAAEESLDRKESHETLELHAAAKALAKTAFDGNEVKSERKHIVVGGARKLYQFTESPLVSDGVVIGVAQDVTELEGMQEELQRHINAQSELLESVTSAIAVFGSDQRLKFFNYAFVRLWGVDEMWLDTEPSYAEFLEVLREKRRLPEQSNFPQFKQRHLKLFTDLIEPTEEIFHLPDGRTLRVLSIPHALGGVLFAYEDVSDHLALERSYNTLIAVQKATLDNLHEGVVVFGEDGRMRLTNPRFLQLWKLENAALSQQTHVSDLIEKTRSLHQTTDWETYKQNFTKYLLMREVQTKRLERADGSVIDSVVVPLPDGATLITFQDVTDSTLVERSLRERNDALQEADRLKTEFLANVSYELRSPLTSISGFSEMLSNNYFGELSDKQREYVGGIHNASRHLMNLINDILDIASIEAGYMKLNVDEFDIYDMLKSVVQLVSERTRERKQELTFNCPRRIGKMLADETRIKQIVFNLLSNAIKYSEDRGEIILTADVMKREGEEEILLSVEDKGMGITPEEQQAVFSKFYKGPASRKSGAGLGLSMVKSFAELHGGRIELISTPGKGTTVRCYLPRRNPNLLEHAGHIKTGAA